MKSSKPFIQRYLKKLSLWVILLLLAFLVAIYLFGAIVHEVFWEQENELDESTFDFLSTHVISHPLTSFMKAVTFFASSRFLQIAYAALVLIYLWQKDWKRSLEIGIIGIGGYLINYFMKWIFQRPRPDDPLIGPLINFSFPSGHAMSGLIFYGLLTYLIWKTSMALKYKYLVGFFFMLFCLLIGFSRVYLRVHYLSDVVAGFCIGFVWLFVSITLMERLKKRSSREVKMDKRSNDGESSQAKESSWNE